MPTVKGQHFFYRTLKLNVKGNVRLINKKWVIFCRSVFKNHFLCRFPLKMNNYYFLKPEIRRI
jgi:hypothetical protein